MKPIAAIVVTFVVLAATCFAATERRLLLIPDVPFEQKLSDRMVAELATLKDTQSLLTVSSWPSIAELPEWAFAKQKREIAYVFGRPVVSDGYRYAVILGRKKDMIVVRTGGIGGSYEIFVRPNAATPPPEPSS